MLMRACVLIVAAVALAACQNGDPAKTSGGPDSLAAPASSTTSVGAQSEVPSPAADVVRCTDSLGYSVSVVPFSGPNPLPDEARRLMGRDDVWDYLHGDAVYPTIRPNGIAKAAEFGCTAGKDAPPTLSFGPTDDNGPERVQRSILVTAITQAVTVCSVRFSGGDINGPGFRDFQRKIHQAACPDA